MAPNLWLHERLFGDDDVGLAIAVFGVDMGLSQKDGVYPTKRARVSLSASLLRTHQQIWAWLKVKELGLCRFLFLVPFVKMPFWYMNLSHGYLGSTKNAAGQQGAALSQQSDGQGDGIASSAIRMCGSGSRAFYVHLSRKLGISGCGSKICTQYGTLVNGEVD